jgi:tetratricopeptide (TPR) repeat protein
MSRRSPVQRVRTPLPLLAVLLCQWAVASTAARADEGATGSPADTAPPATAPADTAASPAWEAQVPDLVACLSAQDAFVQAEGLREAVKTFRDAWQAHSDNPVLAFLYGRVREGKYGRRMMRDALATRFGAPVGAVEPVASAWAALARREIDDGRLEDAANAADQAVALRSGAHDWATLAWIAAQRGDAATAERAYERAVAARSDYLPARNALVVLRVRRGDVEGALRMAHGTVEAHPRDASAQLHWGMALCRAGSLEAGRAAYTLAMELAGGDATTLAAVASAFRELDDPERAEAALDEALAQDPAAGLAHLQRAVLLLEREDAKEARVALRLAARARPDDPRVPFLEGLALERLGLHAAAVTAFRKARTLARDGSPEELEYTLALTGALERRGQARAAVDLLEDVLKVHPDCRAARLQIVRLQLERRDARAARRHLEAWIAARPEDAEPLFWLAMVQGDLQGDGKSARATLRRYRDLGGKEPAALAWLVDLERDGG